MKSTVVRLKRLAHPMHPQRSNKARVRVDMAKITQLHGCSTSQVFYVVTKRSTLRGQTMESRLPKACPNADDTNR